MPYNPIDLSVAETPVITTSSSPLTSVGRTLSGMTDELIRRVGNRGDLDTEVAEQCLNDAYMEMASSMNLQEAQGSASFVSVVGSAVYLLPPTVKAITAASRYRSNTDQTPLGMSDIHSYRRAPYQVGPAESYFRYGQNLLVLWPHPDAAETIVLDAIVLVGKMVNPDDSPIFTEDWHKLLVDLAESFALDDLGDKVEASNVLNKYVSSVRRRIDVRAEERGSMVAAFRPLRGRNDLRRVPSEKDRDW